MQSRRENGFTLIELLVVIAIIAILAAMLFPVFARARESARKIQCLSNVKNIALAVQIYLTDYDRFPPKETRQEVLGSFGCDTYATRGNPYLRWPVILDEYVKNRDVYRCPSARNVATPEVIYPYPDWFRTFTETWTCSCLSTWPRGWGGTVTDSAGADCTKWASAATGAPEMTIQLAEGIQENWGKSLSSVSDVTQYIVVAEWGNRYPWWGAEMIAYPELCKTKWGYSVFKSPTSGCVVHCDQNNAGQPIDGVCGIAYSKLQQFWTDPSMRKRFARHLGGNNYGFADGHAQWMDADAFLAFAGNWKDPNRWMETGVYCQCLPDNPNW
jgi:prepilin-type N-terminal cleavage/methylation domain-containing protein/prepilin-type processing-associated H-X9-DG protein